MKFHRTLLFVIILLLIFPNYAVSQKEGKETESPIRGSDKGQIDPVRLENLHKSAEQGIVFAQFNLGSMYYTGRQITQDYEKAIMWYRKAAEQGYPPAQFQLGMIYHNGEGVPQDPAEAAKWFRKAALKNMPVAQFNLGLMYLQGNEIPQNYEEAAKWLRMAAEQGYSSAQGMLGAVYMEGWGVSQDYIKAYMWLTLCIDGSTRIQSQVLEKAKNWLELVTQKMTAQQIEEARKLAREWNPNQVPKRERGGGLSDTERLERIRSDAEAEITLGQFNLGMAYLHGDIIPQDYVEAVKWLEKSAEQGYIAAQSELGSIYTGGKGIPQDPILAYKWLTLSIAGINDKKSSDSQAAKELLKSIIEKMMSAEIEEAEMLVQVWKSNYEKKMGDGPFIHSWGVTEPVALTQPMPLYTELARQARIEGFVVLQCIVRKSGSVDDCKIIRGLSYGLDESAIRTVKTKWRFKPGTFLNKPVDFQTNIEFEFRIY